jgi:hypothetical protein
VELTRPFIDGAAQAPRSRGSSTIFAMKQYRVDFACAMGYEAPSVARCNRGGIECASRSLLRAVAGMFSRTWH